MKWRCRPAGRQGWRTHTLPRPAAKPICEQRSTNAVLCSALPCQRERVCGQQQQRRSAPPPSGPVRAVAVLCFCPLPERERPSASATRLRTTLPTSRRLPPTTQTAPPRHRPPLLLCARPPVRSRDAAAAAEPTSLVRARRQRCAVRGCLHNGAPFPVPALHEIALAVPRCDHRRRSHSTRRCRRHRELLFTVCAHAVLHHIPRTTGPAQHQHCDAAHTRRTAAFVLRQPSVIVSRVAAISRLLGLFVVSQ